MSIESVLSKANTGGLEATLKEAQTIVPGARTDAAVTAFPRKGQPPAVIFSGIYLGTDHKPREDVLEHVVTLLGWACFSVATSTKDEAKRLALARHLVEVANEVYMSVLEEWEQP